jgi:hypothetical protein
MITILTAVALRLMVLTVKAQMHINNDLELKIQEMEKKPCFN